MDEAIASGTMTVTVGGGDAAAQLAFEFPADIIGHTGLEEMVGRMYSHRRLESHGNDDGVVSLEDAELEFSMNPERICRVVFRFAPPADNDEGDGDGAWPISQGEGIES